MQKLMNELAYDNYNRIILPYWESLMDKEYGGFYGLVDFNLKVDKLAPKGVILNSRILWFFSNAYLTYGDEDCLCYARHAFEFLRDKCRDRYFGGVYWMMNYDGTVKEDIKHTYNQAFAIYALSSYYDASGDCEALELAFEIFSMIEEVCYENGTYKEAFSREFLPISNEKLSENGVLADRTMNTELHLLEAYTELYRVSNDEQVEEKLREIIAVFKNKIYNPEKDRLEVFFDKDMNSLIDLDSFGHDIEATWLLSKACEILGDSSILRENLDYILKVAEQVYQNGYKDSSLLNECENGIIDTTRIWWVQAEAVVGFLNAYKYTSEEKYLQAAQNILNFIEDKLVDSRDNSEWFWSVDENFEPSSHQPITEPWKCPYHNGRMCFEIQERGF